MTGDLSNNKLNILFLICDMQSGGAQRVASLLCNAWAGRGDRVTIVTYEPETAKPFYPLSDKIDLLRLDLQGTSSDFVKALTFNAKRILRISKIIKNTQPDAILCFGYDVSVLGVLSAMGLHKNVIACERSDPSVYPDSGIWKKLRNYAYRHVDQLVVQTSASNEYCRQFRQDVHIIPNPVIRPEITLPSDIKMPTRRFIASLGRLSQEKGHDILIEAFSGIAGEHPDTDLLLIGDGPCREFYEKKVSGLGLSERVHFAGQSKNPFPVLEQASVFILPSRFEGFPNALAEAMALGLPCVAAGSAAGAKALIDYGRNGLIVPGEDPQALGEAISSLLLDGDYADRLGKQAAEITEFLGIDTILEMWDTLIKPSSKDDAGQRS